MGETVARAMRRGGAESDGKAGSLEGDKFLGVGDEEDGGRGVECTVRDDGAEIVSRG